MYTPIPPPSSIGHRAGNWDVDGWAKAVTVKVVTVGDELAVKLLDQETAELFAKCPVPNDKPVLTAVDPVVDSSRYFVLRVVDEDSGRHAFVGLGFRERNEASDFNAAISGHREYLRRKDEAEKIHIQYEAEEGTLKDYSLKPGEKIHIEVPKKLSQRGAQQGGTIGSPKLAPVVGTSGSGLPTLTPPPPAHKLKATGPQPPSPGPEGKARRWGFEKDDGVNVEEKNEAESKEVPSAPNMDLPTIAKDGNTNEIEDDWGEFVG